MIAAEKFLFRIINIKKERAVNFSFSTSHFQFPISFLIPHSEEPITRSFHLPYLPSESTLSRIFLFLEAPPTGFFAGVSIIGNHKKAVVLYCLRHMQAAQKDFSNGEKSGKFMQPSAIFLGCYANVSVFLREIKELPHIS